MHCGQIALLRAAFIGQTCLTLSVCVNTTTLDDHCILSTRTPAHDVDSQGYLSRKHGRRAEGGVAGSDKTFIGSYTTRNFQPDEGNEYDDTKIHLTFV